MEPRVDRCAAEATPPEHYEAPRVETVLTQSDLAREVQYAGRASRLAE